MKIDVFLTAGTEATALRELGLRAEAGGIHGLWASSFPGARDPFLSLVPLALASTTLRIGVVPISPYEIHPVKLSEMIHTLNEMAGGRARRWSAGSASR